MIVQGSCFYLGRKHGFLLMRPNVIAFAERANLIRMTNRQHKHMEDPINRQKKHNHSSATVSGTYHAVRRNHSITHRQEKRDLIPPSHTDIGEAMDEHHSPLCVGGGCVQVAVRPSP